MFFSQEKASQPEFRVNTEQVVMPARCFFYSKLEENLESFGFANFVFPRTTRAVTARQVKVTWKTKDS